MSRQKKSPRKAGLKHAIDLEDLRRQVGNALIDQIPDMRRVIIQAIGGPGVTIL